MRYVVCTVTEMPAGKREIVQVGGRSIGVFNANGNYYALRNTCPHQGAPLCLGRLTGTTLSSPPGTYHYGREGEILACPWHGWEFDITTGKSLYDPNKCLVKVYDVTIEPLEEALETYPVTVEDGLVVLYI